MAHRRAALPVLALTWLAFTLCVAGLTRQSLWRDEVDALRFATAPLASLLNMFRAPGQNGPLFFLALRPWLAVAGVSEFALRFPSAAAATLAVPLLFSLVRRLAGERKIALIAALLLATAPMHIWYGQEAKMYAALTALIVAALLATDAAARRGGWWRWTLLYLLTSLAFYTHLLAALIVPVQALWLLILPGASRWPLPRRLWNAGFYLAALIAPYLPLLAWQSKMLRGPVWATGHAPVAFWEMWGVLLGSFCRGVLSIELTWTLLPFLVALIAALALRDSASLRATSVAPTPAARPRPRPGVVLLLLWLVFPLLAVYLISLKVPIFNIRYLIWALPAFVTLLGLGVIALWRAWRPLGAVVLALMLVLNFVSLGVPSARAIKSDFRAAARFVLEHRQPDDLLIYQIPYIRYTFTYYASAGHDPEDPAWRGLDGPTTNHGMSEAEVAAEMARGTAGKQAVWLIASEVPLRDERGLTERWLAGHGAAGDHADFTRVSVTRYELTR